MTETERIIPIPGTDKKIHGLLREVPDAPLVVFIHGLTAYKNETKYYLGARALEQAGFSSFRFDLYSGESDARKLLDCTIDMHADDLDLVVETLKDEQPDRPITVIGHSLGGLTILVSKQQAFDAVVLWDATPTGWWKDQGTYEDEHTVREPRLGCYRLKGGYDVLIGEDMLSYRRLDSNALIARLHKPVKLIASGMNEKMVDLQREYFEHANEPKALAVIDGADHNFTNGETMTELFAETVDWLNRHGR